MKSVRKIIQANPCLSLVNKIFKVVEKLLNMMNDLENPQLK